jgi:hypothetical protein
MICCSDAIFLRQEEPRLVFITSFCMTYKYIGKRAREMGGEVASQMLEGLWRLGRAIFLRQDEPRLVFITSFCTTCVYIGGEGGGEYVLKDVCVK